MPSEMVERVARAILSAGQERERDRIASWPYYIAGSFYATPWDDLDSVVQDDMIALAGAAIEAMREPTDTMIDAGVDARRALYDRMEAAGQDTKTVLVANHPAGTIYAAMIDAALKPS